MESCGDKTPRARSTAGQDQWIRAGPDDFLDKEWLMREGFLRSAIPCISQPPYDKLLIESSKTKAWGDGGYYGRRFL
jgi:hypothetical protein